MSLHPVAAGRKYLKRALVNVFRRAITPLNAGMREAMIRELMPGTRPQALVGDFARQCGLAAFVAYGTSGAIRGSLDDEAALLRYARDGSWAPNLRRLFDELFAPQGGTYVDIGANIGLTVIPIAQNPAVDCHAFEPAPENVEHLKANVAVNCPHGNVRVHALALFESDAELPFELASRHSGDHRLRVGAAGGDMGEQARLTIPVPARRLDGVLTEIRRPLGVKIDTQGAEPFVIAGGVSVLAQADCVALEFWPYSMNRMGSDATRVIDFCRTFRRGSVAGGDTDPSPEWQPIDRVVAHLADYATNRMKDPSAYLDVLLRR